MSHLTILTTVPCDVEWLASSLESPGHSLRLAVKLKGIAGIFQQVVLHFALLAGDRLSWLRHADCSLALVGYFQRLLGGVTRRCLAEMALRQACSDCAVAMVSIAY